ncbi:MULTISPECIES: hypothetical protein [unclassified Streptomyces]|uniref:Uncharacterized protein n=1 Tax=Streptomyces sp. NBC_00119 TaxID=2975659 RepID=A0AAU1UPJ7_9ACTN|nr:MULTISPECIES: hypothetical protein [unclassified Streptomyces]MCX4641552.1 hypothetical protein [Streptomyces sp. NBC_01446]MCX5322027.1 hypothetical protein [Streptomyces sp. NBC_00120]
MVPLEQVTVPAQQRVHTYQEQEMPQFLPWEVVEQAGEDDAVGVVERGLADLALQDQQLVPQRQDLDLLAPVTHRQQAQEREDVGGSAVGQAQQHDSSSCRFFPVRVKTAGGRRVRPKVSDQGGHLGG